MSLRQLSIQWKITLLAGLCLAGIVTLLVGLSLYRMEHSSELVKASSMEMLTEVGPGAASNPRVKCRLPAIRQQFMDAYQYGHGFSRQVLFLREQAEKRFLDAFDLREDMTRQVKSALQANPELLGLSLVFEANALDGKDELFAGQAELGSNDKGRFALYWSQPTPGKVTSMALPESDMATRSTGPSGQAGQRLVHLPAHHAQAVRDRTRTSMMIDGQNVLMTSIVFPLMVNGKVIASLSVDINLNSLQAISQGASKKLYDGQTSREHHQPHRPARRLQPGRQQTEPAPGCRGQPAVPNCCACSPPAATTASLHSHQQLKVLAPFQPIPGGKVLGRAARRAGKVLVGPAEALKKQLDDSNTAGTLIELGLGMLAALIGLLLVWLMARSVTRPILGVAHMLEDIASGEGDLTRRLAYDKKDELVAVGRLVQPLPRQAATDHCRGRNARCRTPAAPRTSRPPSPPRPAPPWSSNTAGGPGRDRLPRNERHRPGRCPQRRPSGTGGPGCRSGHPSRA